MARPKKNAKNISFYMDAEIVERLHEYAEEKGQTLTMATERLLKESLDRYDKEGQNYWDGRIPERLKVKTVE
jgi:predicted DNA-binding protein